MIEESQMGSQTLEILRQGVWASLTGGWFYDPHQDVFCNTFHLYIWLYLLCVPFCIYVYCPPSLTVWYFYCGSVTLGLTVLKLVNYGLHYMYDTKECIIEEIEDIPQELKKEEEGIELQELPNKSSVQTSRTATKLPHLHDIEFGPLHSTDAESLEFDIHQTDYTEGACKPSSTIDLKAEVHRKNSSESSDDNPIIPVSNQSETKHTSDRRPKHQRSKTDSYVTVIKEDKKVTIMDEQDMPLKQRSLLQSVKSELERDSGNFDQIETTGRRYSNFTSLSFLPSSVQTEIKPTGSLELGYIDKNLNQPLTSEGFYFKPTVMGVRRIRSTVLEACCPPLSLDLHPNSLEILGAKSLTKNPLPPPSSSLTRNQHLNLCSYYGSEIVYPIAEQSDEHQTSHGPDTDLESMEHRSESEVEENDQGSHSPLMYIKQKKLKSVPYEDKYQQPIKILSATTILNTKECNNSKDKLIENNDNSNSSTTPDMQDARTDFYNTDNEISDKNLSFSNSSMECEDNRAGSICPGTEEKIDKPVRRKPQKICRIVKPGEDDPPVVVRKKKIAKTRRRAMSDDQAGHSRCQHQRKFPNLTEPLKRDNGGWCSTTTVSLEHDVSKVLQDQVPSTSSLGAIPKKTRRDTQSSITKKLPKSESEKCSVCRCKPRLDRQRNEPTKENKVTQTQLRHSESLSPVDGLETGQKNNLSKTDTNKSDPQSKNEDGSSNGSNNELSTLLPPAPLLSVFLQSRPSNISSTMGLESIRSNSNRMRLKRMNRAHRRRTNPVGKKDNFLSGYGGTYTSKNFNDTTESCSHCTADEYGDLCVLSYDDKGGSIEPNGPSTSQGAEVNRRNRRRSDTRRTVDIWDSNSTESICNSSVSTILDVSLQKSMQPMNFQQNSDQFQRIKPPFEQDRLLLSESVSTKFKCIIPKPTDENVKRTKSYYAFKVWPPRTYVKISMDRLKLLALLDRNLTLRETIISIILGGSVCALGSILLYKQFYRDVSAFAFCFVTAGCQYSLVKSVQPDAASPTHGFNRIIAYSRPLYFCIFASLVLILDSNLSERTRDSSGYDLNSFRLTSGQYLRLSRDFFVTFILAFPLLFSFGLFPQINTFLVYILEQIDMHAFGGNAASNLSAAFYCVFRSFFTVIILGGVCYGGLSETKGAQHILFSIFCACLVAACYHLSRSTSDPTHMWNMLKDHLWLPDVYREQQNRGDGGEPAAGGGQNDQDKLTKTDSKGINTKEKTVKFPNNKEQYPEDDVADPLPLKLQKINNARLKNDLILCSLIAILVFAVHASTVFTVLQPELGPVLWSIGATLGFILHYIIPQFRKHLPWLCIARPILRSQEHEHYQIKGPAKIMWFETVYVYFSFLERNIVYPLLFLSVLTEDSPRIVSKYGTLRGSFIVVICGIKCLRNSYSNQSSQYLILVFTALFYKYDVRDVGESFLVIYFFMVTIYNKIYELLLKIQFVVTYIAPWQITWGSAFHAFAQPFSVPHSAMLFLQAILSSCLSMPLNPFLGSAIFIISYVRPIKFWERDYNTRRVDHSNTPLSSHLDRNLGADDNNLNSLFYEHLTRSLQTSLCGDLKMGRWGPVNQGDCFVLASDYLNCLVHIIEMGNDVTTFQMRGLEFRGTYCQQREVEAITEGVEENDGCCCCDTGHLPNMLSVNAAFNQRWLAWEVMAAKYILEGYSISDNSAVTMLQVFEFRKVLVSYYVKSIIFYLLRSPKLEHWLFNPTILKALSPMEHRTFVDLDPTFNSNIDEDYDIQNSGITKNSFMQIHGDWIKYCVERSEKNIECGLNAPLTLLCFALSLLGRRTLGAVSHNTVSGVEFFLYGLHALFKGDFRISCARDEWVFSDMDLLKTVVAPGVRMSLKLHQDHFMAADEYEELSTLYDSICKHEEELVISHEGDPAWRRGVLSGAPSLLALRHVFDEGNDEYKIIMLNKRYLSFRVIKVNKECVRGLWAGQQQELVYFRNRNPERGSIQNAKQALRNIINSSCDQPIGYPIYVSPLTTSYAETNEQYSSLVGGSVTLKKIKNYFFNTFRRIRKRCGEGCSSGSANREEVSMGHEGMYAMTPMSTLAHTGSQSTDGSHLGGSIGRGSSLSRASLGGNRGSLVSMGKPTSSTLVSLAGLFKERDERSVSQVPDVQIRGGGEERVVDTNSVAERDCAIRVRITDSNAVFDSLNQIRKVEILWPNEFIRIRGGKTYWKDWKPEVGMDGTVVHKWLPSHKDPSRRSHIEKTILLVNIDDKYVPIAENGVQDLGAEV
ncbi:pecanex-like protein 1 isoform X1 [Diorhabda carinulata]|uniref:pecanex-like protein 1 isoform X1 n=1 Tax=Diorhabda carinulata TaxID=1163345 RepID=UPI0025A0651E|nr:pecanex-like protein 1 isoform X1 [Diorhabda carinulata]